LNQKRAKLAADVLEENAQAELTAAVEKLARTDAIREELTGVLVDYSELDNKPDDLASVHSKLKNVHDELTKAYNELNQKRTELAAKALKENARAELAGVVKQINKLEKVQQKLITLPKEISGMKTRLAQPCRCANSLEFPACIKCWKFFRGPVPEKFKKQPSAELAAEHVCDVIAAF
jgi:GTP1/Obg family GTP-binding protein